MTPIQFFQSLGSGSIKQLMHQRSNRTRSAQLIVVLLCALALKLYYSTASVNQLRWILTPTTILVELVSGQQFEFESHAGYLNNDRTFLIAASCAGVNFLLTSFLMLSLRRLWRNRSQTTRWSLIPAAALFAYLATLVTNTVRISVGLWMQQASLEIGGLSSTQLHRLEGVFVYFGFLLLLFLISEKSSYQSGSGAKRTSSVGRPGLVRQALFPLLIYYSTTLGIPLANIAYRRTLGIDQGTDFWEHSLFVLMVPLVVTPLLLLLTLANCHAFRQPQSQRFTPSRQGAKASKELH